jgi:hypothetical protein
MTDKLVDTVEKGLEASKTLHSPAFQTAMITIKARLMDETMSTNVDQEEKRTEIWRKYQLLQWLEAELTEVIDSGTIATNELERRNQNH